MKQPKSELLIKNHHVVNNLSGSYKIFYNPILRSIIIILAVIMLFSCKNDLATIQSLSTADSLPLEIAYDIELTYSDSGKIQAFLSSPLMTRDDDENEIIEFPEGFRVLFYDSDSIPQSEITALYGIIFEGEERMEARNNVVVRNIEKNEKLETEHLIWDRKAGTIFTDEFIKISKTDQVIFGDGLKSDQNFESYEILNPTGELNIYPDDI